MMADNIEVNQKAAIGSKTTQIAVQNNCNYNGLTPIEACNLATNLFYDNFPKLQACAMNIAEQRVNEFMKEVAKKLEHEKITDMTPFADPDIQYALFEAQKQYARLGVNDRLSALSTLIAKRVQHNDENIPLKIAIDKAIDIATFLTDEQLDYLSLLFLCTQTASATVKTIEQLGEYLSELATTFSKADPRTFLFLNMLGCLQFRLVDIPEKLANAYNLKKKDIEAVCPELILKLSGDYTTSHIGTVLAITHIEAKIPNKLNPAIWIHD